MTDRHHVGPVPTDATEEELHALGRELFDRITAMRGETGRDEDPAQDPDVR